MWITECKLIPGTALALQQTVAHALCASVLFFWIDMIQTDKIWSDIHFYLHVHVHCNCLKLKYSSHLKADIKIAQRGHVLQTVFCLDPRSPI